MLVVHAPALPAGVPLPMLGAPVIRARERFSAANGMLTPSLKHCRRTIARAHHAQLLQLHRRGDGLGQLSAAVKAGAAAGGGVSDSDSLACLGVDSVQWARLAAELSLSVHAVAAAGTVADLRRLYADARAADSSACSPEPELEAGTRVCMGTQSAGAGVAEGSAGFAQAALADYERWQRVLSKDCPRSQDAEVAPSPTPGRRGTGGAAAMHGPPRWAAVMVTGATGHIGQHFCELLERKGVRTVRVARSLGFDISLPRFGLAQARYTQLRAECDAVVHCAAVVNWSASWSAVRGSNVDGTAEARPVPSRPPVASNIWPHCRHEFYTTARPRLGVRGATIILCSPLSSCTRLCWYEIRHSSTRAYLGYSKYVGSLLWYVKRGHDWEIRRGLISALSPPMIMGRCAGAGAPVLSRGWWWWREQTTAVHIKRRLAAGPSAPSSLAQFCPRFQVLARACPPWALKDCKKREFSSPWMQNIVQLS